MRPMRPGVPVEAIKLADLIDGMGLAHYIDAREQACDFSCDAVQCILACPTGSLTYHKPAHSCRCARRRTGQQAHSARQGKRCRADAEPAERIGVARLTRPESCLAMQGKGFQGTARGPLRRQSCATWSTAGSPSGRRPNTTVTFATLRAGMPDQRAITVENGAGPDGRKAAPGRA